MLHIKNTYVKSYDERAKCMYFLIEDDNFLEKYNTIWDKVSADIKREFGSKPAFFFFKAQIKSYCDEVTNFYNKEIPRVVSNILV